MEERRWPWFLSAALLMASGVVAWVVTYLWWLPCRGAMLVATIFEVASTVDFSDGCLVRMDSGSPFPLPTAVASPPSGLYALSAATIVLAALGWLVLVVAQRTSVLTRCAGWAFGLSMIMLAIAGLSPVERQEEIGRLGSIAFVVVDVTGLLALVCAVAEWRLRSVRTMVRTVLVLGAATAFGVFRTGLDYVVMGTWSQANWDMPPGSGYLAALGLVLTSVAVVVLTLVRVEPLAAAPSQQVQQVDPVARLGQ